MARTRSKFVNEIKGADCYELCPHCNQAVEIKGIGIQECPECGKPILPCSKGDMDSVVCNNCIYYTKRRIRLWKTSE